MRPKNLPHAAHDHDSTPVRTRSKSTHVSLATTSPRPRDSLDRAHRPPPQSSREVTYIGALAIERRANGATRFSLDRTTTSTETDGRRPVDDAPIHSAAREKAKKRTKREPNERTRARDATKRRRDATRRTHDTHTHKKNHASARIPRARARERRRRASPTEDGPAARIRRLVSQSGWKHTHHTPHGTEKERPTRTHKTTKHTQKTKRQRGFPACSQASGGWKYTHHTHHTHHTPHTPHTTHGTEKERPTRTHKTTQNTKKKPSVSADSQLVPKPVLMRPKQA